jgi:hypothetical protein
MDHMKLSDELRNQLLENAAWGKAGITPRLDEEVIEERKKSKKDKKEEKEEGGDPKAFGGKKGDKSQTHKGEDYENCGTEHEDAEGSEELQEAVHVCPLCVSQLDEAIEEDRILEHLNVVVGLVDRLSQLQEGDEDIDTVIDETISELLFQDTEEE